MSSFIENINRLAEKLDIIIESNEIFDDGIVPVLEEIAELNLAEAIMDLKKGEYLGNRKIDINLALNMQGITEDTIKKYPDDAEDIWTDASKTVYYDKATVTFVDGEVLEIPFTFDGNPINISTHGDLLIQFNSNTAFLTKLESTLIAGFSADVVGEFVRIYDAIGQNSNIERIQLNAVSGLYKEEKPIYFWAKTTSAFRTLAMRSGDIIKLGNEIDNIILLATQINGVLELQNRIPELVDTYTDGVPNNDLTVYNALTELMELYTNLEAVITVYNDIKALGTNYIQSVATDLQGVNNIGTVADDLNLGVDSNINIVGSNIDDVVTVSDNIGNVNINSANIDNININATNIANVNNVGNNIANVNTVSTDIASVNTVSTNIANVNTVSGNIIDINSVFDNLSDIGIIVTNLNDVNTVSSNIDNVNNVNSNIADINSVSDNLSNIDIIVTNLDDINTLYSNIDNINNVNSNITDINSVSDNISDINLIVTNLNDINTLYSNIDNINTVSTNIVDVNSVYDNLLDINLIVTNLSSIGTVSSNIDNINSIITNIEPILDAEANATTATEQAGIATNQANIATTQAGIATTKANEIKNVSVGNTVTALPSTPASVVYSSSTGKFTFIIPKGDKGDRGESFQVSAVGTVLERGLYDDRTKGFSFLAIDEASIYFKMSDTVGDWSPPSPFGKGEIGDTGATGNGVAFINFTSTTNPDGIASVGGYTDTYTITYTDTTTDTFTIYNGRGISSVTFTSTTSGTGLPSQSGADDTYTITFTDNTTTTFVIHNGLDNDVTSVAGKIGDVVITKEDVGLGNVDNTSDSNKPISTAVQTALNLKAPLKSPTFTGTVSGITKTMVGLGSVDNTSDIDKPVSNATSVAISGKVDKVAGKALSDENYTLAEKNKLGGIESGAEVNTVLSVSGKTGNVSLVKADVGLPDVDNTSDLDKPISDATSIALAGKVDKVAGKQLSDINFTEAYQTKLAGIESGAQVNVVNSVASKTGNVTLVKGDVGLGNVDNTADLNKPISNATNTALANKVDKIAGKGLSTEDFTTADKTKLTGIESGAEVNTVLSVAGKTGSVTLTKLDVGLSNVNNTSDLNKPVSNAAQTALNAKQNISTALNDSNYATKIFSDTTTDTDKTWSSDKIISSIGTVSEFEATLS